MGIDSQTDTDLLLVPTEVGVISHLIYNTHAREPEELYNIYISYSLPRENIYTNTQNHATIKY